MAGKEINKWADDFMFTAEESKASEGPKAFLLQGTPDPLGSIAAMAKMYMGEVVRDKSDVTDEERRYYLAEMQKTKLKAPLEAVTLHWMIEGVTRSYTHQMVRQRTAVYAQESLRFAVKEDVASAVALPPYIADTLPQGEWIKAEGVDTTGWHDGDADEYVERNASDEQIMRFAWDDEIAMLGSEYLRLVNLGMPQEDARGLLPHNITTRLNYVTNLRNYQDHAGNRLCTQAQFEWRMVWVKMLTAMKDYCTDPGHEAGLNRTSSIHRSGYEGCDNWQWKAIAGLFMPVCYLTGKCQFEAEFDRKCSIRARVNANAEIGRHSSQWSEAYDHTDQEEVPADGVIFDHGNKNAVFIGAIHPAEWLLDAAAAR